MKKNILFFILLLVIGGSSIAFDGNRKGFVIGGGIGISPQNEWKTSQYYYKGYSDELKESKSGAAVNMFFGYAVSNHIVLLLESNSVAYSSDIFNENTASQVFSGYSVQYYVKGTGRTLYLTFGYGNYFFEINNEGKTDTRDAVLIGGGYEFSPHYQISFRYSYGKTLIPGNVFFDLYHTSLTFSAMAF